MEDHVLELLPGFVLECLDDEELIKVARHLSLCESCSRALLAYRETVDQLTINRPLLTPPAHLKTKILNTIRQQVESRHPLAKKVDFGQGFRSFFASPLKLTISGAAVLLILLLGIYSIYLGQQVTNLQAAQVGSHVHLLQLKGTGDAPQTMGYLMIFSKEMYGTLVVEDAPGLDAGHQYQLWLLKDGKRSSGGVFSVNGSGYGVLGVTANQPLENFQSIGITIEPAGGSSGPTGKKILGGDL